MFNQKAKAGDEDLVWADTVEDVEEQVDDIDTNKTAEGGDEWREKEWLNLENFYLKSPLAFQEPSLNNLLMK